MLRILSIEDCNGVFVGYLEDGEVYRDFEVSPQEVRLPSEYPKSEYGEYKRFAAILGKFDPDARFFIEPKEVSTLDYKELESIVKRMGKA